MTDIIVIVIICVCAAAAIVGIRKGRKCCTGCSEMCKKCTKKEK